MQASNSNSFILKTLPSFKYAKKTEELTSRRQRFPVMAFIHGGNPFGNCSRYGAQYFMDEDVIFITFHYRLGALGNNNNIEIQAC